MSLSALCRKVTAFLYFDKHRTTASGLIFWFLTWQVFWLYGPSISEIDCVLISDVLRVSVFKEPTEVDLSVCKDIMPEGWQEVWDVVLCLETLDSLLDISGIGVMEEVSFV